MSDAYVLVLNASYEPLGVVSLRKAMIYLFHERAVIVEAVPGVTYRSGQGEHAVPLVVQFTRNVSVPYSYRPLTFSKRAVLERDNYTCAYCGVPKRGRTIDHVKPKSRGGRDSFLNTVACCSPCNNRKADRTPEEAQMPLRFKPREVFHRDRLLVSIAATGANLTKLQLA